MSEGIVPLRQKGQERTALARFDLVAAELLAQGQAPNLQAARIVAILMDLREQRDQMTAVLADLRSRGPTGDARLDEANANLVAAINQGIVQIDLFIAHAQIAAGHAARPGSEQTETPR